MFLKQAIDALGAGNPSQTALKAAVAALLISGACRIMSSLAKEAQGPLFTPVSQVPISFLALVFSSVFYPGNQTHKIGLTHLILEPWRRTKMKGWGSASSSAARPRRKLRGCWSLLCHRHGLPGSLVQPKHEARQCCIVSSLAKEAQGSPLGRIWAHTVPAAAMTNLGHRSIMTELGTVCAQDT